MDESIQKKLTQTNETADVLRWARARIDTPEKWAPQASLIAMGRVCAALQVLKDAIGLGPGQYVSSWNDNRRRMHAEVLQAFDRAIELAERG